MTTRSFELGYSVRPPAYRAVQYRSGVALELPTEDLKRRRLATPFRRDEIREISRQLEQATRGMEWSPRCNAEVRAVLNSRREFARSRAQTRGKGFTLTLDDLVRLYDDQGGLCAVTGLMLDTGADPEGSERWRKPFRVSLDRIDSAGGYTPENVRLVCAAVNNALGSWGEGVFAVIAAAFMIRSRSDRPVSSAGERPLHTRDVASSILALATGTNSPAPDLDASPDAEGVSEPMQPKYASLRG